MSGTPFEENSQKEIRAICKSSQGAKKQVQQAFEKLERDPSSFDLLDILPPDLQQRTDFSIRKVYITGRKYDFRIVFVHLLQHDHVELLYVFRRKHGYPDIDWDWIRGLFGGQTQE